MVYAKWLRSLRYGNEFFKLIDPEAYYEAYNQIVARILSQESCLVKIAALSDDLDVALGFCVTRGTILDFVHVHKDNRKIGIATKLIPGDIDTITHLTMTGMSIWNNKYKHWKFNPFA